MATFEVCPFLFSKYYVKSIFGEEKRPQDPLMWPIQKRDSSIVYVKLYGDRGCRSQRFRVLNALENYFHVYGKIRDLGRLKEKYSYLGDFFIVFESSHAASL